MFKSIMNRISLSFAYKLEISLFGMVPRLESNS